MTGPAHMSGSPEATKTLGRRRRRRRLRRLVLFVILLAVIGTGVGLIVSGHTVLPFFSQKVHPLRYQTQIASAAARYRVDPYLVAAVAQTESGFDPSAVSSAGAVGVMQLMPDTADWVTSLGSWHGDGKPTLTNAADSIELGSCYLAYLQSTFGEFLPALAAYNAGQGNVKEWVRAAGKRAFQLADIRFPETRAFVQKVQHYEDLYRRIYPKAFAAQSVPVTASSRGFAEGGA